MQGYPYHHTYLPGDFRFRSHFFSFFFFCLFLILFFSFFLCSLIPIFKAFNQAVDRCGHDFLTIEIKSFDVHNCVTCKTDERHIFFFSSSSTLNRDLFVVQIQRDSVLLKGLSTEYLGPIHGFLNTCV